MDDRVAVFTPDNEPYLGLEALLCFDNVIVWGLEKNTRAAAYTHKNKPTLTPLQHAACQIIPQGINIALSIRELVRQGYLFSSIVLMRPLVERAAVISYLAENPQAVQLWESGWSHGKRPALPTMIQSMSGASIDADEAREICAAHNHIVHADPVSTYYNLVHLGDGSAAYASGKMLDNPNLTQSIAMEALSFLIVLIGQLAKIFPGVVERTTSPGTESIQ